MTEEKHGIEVNWVQALAGSLAAMSSAVLLSTVGVAGTIIGAAVGSIIATVGSAVYSYYLRLSRRRIAETHSFARARVARARASVRGAVADVEGGSTHPERQLQRAESDLARAGQELRDAEDIPASVSWKEVLAGLPWRRIVLSTAALFVAAMLVIVTFELITGRAVSTYTGGTDQKSTGTSIPGWSGTDKRPRPKPSPTLESPSTTPTPSSTPSVLEPTEQPSTTEPSSATPVEPSPSESLPSEPLPSEPPVVPSDAATPAQ